MHNRTGRGAECNNMLISYLLEVAIVSPDELIHRSDSHNFCKSWNTGLKGYLIRMFMPLWGHAHVNLGASKAIVKGAQSFR